MKRYRKLFAAAGGAILILAVAGVTKPGRTTLNKLISLLKPGSQASNLASVEPQAADVEQRARAKHGWDTAPQSAVMRGTITYFDPTGAVARRGALTVYRRYPDQIRVEIEHQGIIQVQGFDSVEFWRARADRLTDEQEREIRAWLRVWPERLFVSRARGNEYREAGRQIEDSGPEMPGRVRKDLGRVRELEQVEVEDVIEDGRGSGNSPRRSDRRSITYLLDGDGPVIYSARWLEPDDPSPRSAARQGESSRAVRIDFGEWRRLEGVLWPMEITRWLGGQLDWQILMDEVQVNRGVADSVFRRP